MKGECREPNITDPHQLTNHHSWVALLTTILGTPKTAVTGVDVMAVVGQPAAPARSLVSEPHPPRRHNYRRMRIVV